MRKFHQSEYTTSCQWLSSLPHTLITCSKCAYGRKLDVKVILHRNGSFRLERSKRLDFQSDFGFRKTMNINNFKMDQSSGQHYQAHQISHEVNTDIQPVKPVEKEKKTRWVELSHHVSGLPIDFFILIVRLFGHRTVFTNYQLAVLESTFQQSQYPNNYVRRDLANELALDESRVQVWFQNRRSKRHKKAATIDGINMVDLVRLRGNNDKTFGVIDYLNPAVNAQIPSYGSGGESAPNQSTTTYHNHNYSHQHFSTISTHANMTLHSAPTSNGIFVLSDPYARSYLAPMRSPSDTQQPPAAKMPKYMWMEIKEYSWQSILVSFSGSSNIVFRSICCVTDLADVHGAIVSDRLTQVVVCNESCHVELMILIYVTRTKLIYFTWEKHGSMLPRRHRRQYLHSILIAANRGKLSTYANLL